MNTRNIKDIKNEYQERYNVLLKSCQVFWAFSDKQFSENKVPLAEGDKYISIGAGGYMPKSKSNELSEGMKVVDKWYKAEIKACKGARRANIAYELANHEAYYTNDITDTLEALGKDYTKKEVLKVFIEEREKMNVNA